MKQLDGLGFSCYRSVGEKPLLLYPFSKINLFIGPNNSGKSNILRYIDKWCRNDLSFTDDDYPNYNKKLISRVFRVVPISETSNLLTGNYSYYSHVIAEVKKIIASDLFLYDKDDNILWYDKVPNKEEIAPYATNISPTQVKNYALDYANTSTSDIAINVVKILSRFFDIVVKRLPKVQRSIYIKANRDLFDHSENTFLEKETIIERFNKTVNHKSSDLQSEDDKQRLERFISDLLGQEIHVSVPSTLDSINVISDKNPKEQYSLDQLGSGIHEIIYFALVATLNHGCLVCIDEPEIHMHPRLQREFIEYLLKNTDNQYFIATHSSAFINTSNNEVSVFKVAKDEKGYTECCYASKMSELSTLVDSLGCKASDILQSNCVIWVEGPSDRIYVNYWLHGINADLVEGIDYSIMFYGGRLLNHLSSSTSDTDDLINLMSINRNSFVIMDSDKNSDSDSINETKKRIQEEFKHCCWITSGREIENYLDHEQYKQVAKEIDASFTVKSGQYKNLLSKGSDSLDKVFFAKKLTQTYSNPSYDCLDLKERITELVSFIKKANE